LPVTPPNLALTAVGGLQMNFTNTPGAVFSVLATTNLSLPRSNWTALGAAIEIAAGEFQFTDSTTHRPSRYYQVHSP